MHPLLLRFADGTTFFAGLVLTSAAAALLLRFRGRLIRSTLTVLAIVGMILTAISAVPQPLWAYAVWIVAAVAGLILLHRNAAPCQHSEENAAEQRVTHGRRMSPPLAACLVLFTVSAGLCIAEAPYLLDPKITLPKQATVYVIGDSLSAGIGTSHRCWPDVLAEKTACRVVNLAKAGATASSAAAQLQAVAEPCDLVILEIGGNDLLGGTDAAAFHDSLDALAASLRADGRRVLLVELPLFPFQNAFGRAQRDVAARHGLALLPKRRLAEVLGTQQGTLDGLHLSQAGHDAMARCIANVIATE